MLRIKTWRKKMNIECSKSEIGGTTYISLSFCLLLNQLEHSVILGSSKKYIASNVCERIVLSMRMSEWVSQCHNMGIYLFFEANMGIYRRNGTREINMTENVHIYTSFRYQNLCLSQEVIWLQSLSYNLKVFGLRLGTKDTKICGVIQFHLFKNTANPFTPCYSFIMKGG